MTRNGLPSDLVSVVQSLCEDVSTPRALTVWLMVKYKEWDLLASLAIDPKHYLDEQGYKFSLDSRVSGLLRKMTDLPTSFDRKGVALSNFYASESECHRTSIRLEPHLTQYPTEDKSERLSSFLGRCRSRVREILGPVPDIDNCRQDHEDPFWGSLRPTTVEGRFGPGATFGDKGLRTLVPDKLSSSPTITSAAWPWIFPWQGTAWHDAMRDAGGTLTLVRGNRFTTVPKDCTKDRGIAIEPSINVFYQLAYGRALRKRLLFQGLDLLRVQEDHRRLARFASVDGTLATIDLSNASDTMSMALVRALLPKGWFDVLSRLRSPYTLVEGKWHKLEKFSSMGNGFTFELETLLFLSIAQTAIEMEHGTSVPIGDRLSVFGDDIIVPTEYSEVVLSALRFCGFTPNPKKTFSDGNFRESCGGDYFRGVDSRPFFLKEVPNEPQDWIALANGIHRMASRASDGYFDPCFLRAWFRCLDKIPVQVRKCRGPLHLGDTVIHDDSEKWTVRWHWGIRYIKTYSPVQPRLISWQHWKSGTVLACAVYGLSSGSQSSRVRKNSRSRSIGGVSPRDSVGGYKFSWVAYS